MSGLVGREREQARLDAVVARACSGVGAGIVLEAEAGVGKSSLLDDLRTRASAVASVAWAEADEMEQGRPFGLLLRALGCTPRSRDERRAKVAAILQGAPRSEGDELLGTLAGDRFVVQDAIVELVEELAAEQTLLLAIDDAQWADAVSLTTLGVIARHCRSLPVGIVVACRPWPRPPDLDLLVERMLRIDHELLRLDGLGADDVDALVRGLLGAWPGPRLRASLAAAQGNPFYVRELVRHARDDGRLVVDGGQAELIGELTTGTFMERLVRRLDGMEPVTRNLLQVASLYGPAFDLRDLSALIGEPVVTLQQVTTDARRAGLLRATDDGRLAFTHDLVREAISHDLPGTVREALHREIAHSLIGRQAPVDQVVPHLVIGARPGDSVAVEWLSLAATETAAVDPIGAEQLLAKAQDLSAPEDRLRLAPDRVRMLKWAGELDRAATLARDALAARPDPNTTLRLRIELAETDLLAGRSGQALPALLAAAEGADVARETRAQLWSEVASSALWTLDFDLCERACATAIELAADTGPTTAALAHGLLARRYSFTGDLEAATRHSHLATELAQRFQPTARSVPMFYAGLGLLWTDPVLALDVLQEGLRLAERQGLTWSQPVYYQGLVSAAFDAGRWDEALTYYETGSIVQDELVELGEPSIDAFVGLLHLCRDDPVRAQEMLDKALHAMTLPSARMGSLLYIRWLEAHLLARSGATDRAAAMLLEVCELSAQLNAANAAVTLMADGVELADPAIERERMERVTAVAEQLAEVGHAPVQRAIALRCRAALDGRPELAVEAVAVLESTGRLRDLLQTCLSAGRALVAAGRHDEARTVLTRGVEVAEELGALATERELRALLRAAGAVRGVRSPRKRATFGWESLTDTELHVVRLVRDGLTNAEIGLRLLISRRTVDTHLVHVYRKLGLSSRAALAALAAERLNG